MFNKPTISRFTQDSIDELEASGIHPTPNEILLLYQLGEIASRPDDDGILDFCYTKFGNLKIYPISIGAKLWLQDFIQEFPFDDQLLELASIYAYANSRDIEAFKFESHKECKNTILGFAKRISLTEAEVKDLIDSVISQTLESKKRDLLKNEKPGSIIPALAILINTYGKDKEHWLWRESEETCIKLVEEAINLKNREHGVKVDKKDRSILAFINMKRVVNEIKESRK